MVIGIAVLLAMQLLGEVTSYDTGRVIPGPVIGMAMITLLLVLASRLRQTRHLEEQIVSTSRQLLSNLGVLFVPAGVGIIQHLDLIRDRGIALFLTIFASTVVTLVVTVWAFLATKALLGRNGDE